MARQNKTRDQSSHARTRRDQDEIKGLITTSRKRGHAKGSVQRLPDLTDDSLGIGVGLKTIGVGLKTIDGKTNEKTTTRGRA